MSTTSAKAMREQRAKLAKRIRELADAANNENRDFTAEEKSNWDQVNKDYNDLSRKIEIADRAEQVEADQQRTDEESRRRPTPGLDDVDTSSRLPNDDEESREADAPITAEDRTRAMGAWMRFQSGMDVDDEDMDLARRCGIGVRSKYLDIDLLDTRTARQLRREARALTTTGGTSGVTLIPEGFIASLESALVSVGGPRAVAEILRTTSGNDIIWPTADDTGNEGQRLSQNTPASEYDPTFGSITLQAFKYSSGLVKVPVELLEDSAIDLVSELGRMLGERIGRITATDYTTGNNSDMPNGIVTAATLGKAAAGATAIAADEVYDLVHSVDPMYRVGPAAGFMLHDSVLLYLRKLKDGNGQYLWQSGMSSAEPDRILGYPFWINQKMASTVATNNITLLFGDLSKYKIRDVRSIRLRRLVERYADSDQEGFVAFFRTDGDLLDAGSAPVKYLQQA